MFKRIGRKRTPKHNLQIASFLSFVAGIVGAVGFFSVTALTTNVTGHFSFLVDGVFHLDFRKALIFFLYIQFFFLGSFLSNFLVEYISRKNSDYVYVIPTFIESMILLILGITGKYIVTDYPDFIACVLLFTMGLQNALVTRISNAVVRTTHLTGLFTDLGIEFSQLFFFKTKKSRKELYTIIKLRFTIITFFFLGGITGGFFYTKIQLYTLIIAAVVLLLAIRYESLKLRLRLLQRRINR